MSIVMQINPFDFFTDTNGDALDAGYIWVGQPNLDPRQYPVVAYYDAALTIPAAMPLRTSNGYITRNGSPAFLYISGNYSIRVENKNKQQVYYVADFLMIGNSQAMSTSAFNTFLASLGGPTGASQVGWLRSRQLSAVLDVADKLNTTVLSIWEFSALVTVKPVAGDPNTWDWTPALQGAIDHASTIADAPYTVALDPRVNYQHTGLTMNLGVILDGMAARGTTVNPLATPVQFPGATLTLKAVAADAVLMPNTAYGATLRGIAFDNSLQPTGTGVVFKGSGVLRTGQLMEHCLVYQSKDFNILIGASSKEVLIKDCFSRGGVDINTARTNVGVSCESQDCKFEFVWSGFCITNNILENGIGSNRYDNSDSFGCRGYGVQIQGTGSPRFETLQSDSSGAGGLKVAGNSRPFITNLVAVNNRALVAGPDVFVTDEARVEFIRPYLAGVTSGLATYAFECDNDNNTSIIGGAITSSSYPSGPLNNMALAYWQVQGLQGLDNPLYGVTDLGPELNTSLTMFPIVSGDIPGWTRRNSATLASFGSAPYSYPGATQITSGAIGGEAIDFDLTASIAKYLGKRIRVKVVALGSGLTFLGNQRLVVTYGVSAVFANIKNNGTFTTVALDEAIPTNATSLIVRLVASNSVVPGLNLAVAQCSIKIY